jgi:alpha-tubulin suppressor-like RCC1 family protein
MISAGGEHTCALASNGEVFCWGFGGRGQLGNSQGQSSDNPVKVVSQTNTSMSFHKIASGGAHTCGITRGSNQTPPSVLCWGANDKYQLGVSGTNAYEKGPVAVDHDWQGRPINLGLGDLHSCAVSEPSDPNLPNKLWCWGANAGGQLGQTSTNVGDSADPLEVVLSNQIGAERVDGGFGHTCAVSSQGFIDCWGLNAGGQLGTGDTNDTQAPTPVQNTPQFKWVRAGDGHTCALERDNSRPYCWGSNVDGAIGTGSVPPTQYTYPTQLGTLTAANTIDAGRSFTCATDRNDNVLCWGLNGNGQLGTGNTDDAASPQPVVCARANN